MGLKAKVAVSLVVAAIAAGGGTYVYRQRTAIAAGGISGPAQIRTDGVSQSDAWEVQQAFSKYQQACKNRDMNGYVTAFDASSRSQINATELPAKEPEMLDMIAAAKIDRMVQANATSRMLKRDVIRASDGDLKWFFAKSPEGWKIVNQKFNYDSGALLDLIRRQRQHDPQGAIQVPDRTSSSEEIDAIKKAFRRYQKAARARDGEATADLMDLEMLGLMTGETPAQIRDEIIRFSGSAQGLWQASENVRIDSVKIRKTVKYSDEWLDMANARNPHSGIDKIPKGKGPYYFLCADDLAFYYRKTPEGWKLISSNLDVD